MSEAAPITQTRTGANGVKAEGAIDVAARLREIDSTPADDSTVQLGDDGKPKDDEKKTPDSQQDDGADKDADNEDDSDDADADANNSDSDDDELDELKHSDATLQAEIEKAKRTGLDDYKREDKKLRDTRRSEINALIKANNGETPAVLRAVQNKLDALPALEEGQRYTSDDFDPVIKTVRDALSLSAEAAEVVVGEMYEAEINSLITDEAERKAFWQTAEGIDPGLHAHSVLRALIDHLALSSETVSKADPQKLIDSNVDLKAHLASEKDKSYKAGRLRGQKDPTPEKRGSEQSITKSGEWPKDADGKIDVHKALASMT